VGNFNGEIIVLFKMGFRCVGVLYVVFDWGLFNGDLNRGF